MLQNSRIHVHIDTKQRNPLRRIWRYIGYDEPNYTYTPSGKVLLSKLGAMVDAPYFIRCHFLFCSGDGKGSPKWGSTNIYTEDTEGTPVYNWTIIDRILDTYIGTGCIPFVELGFMPEELSTAPADVVYDDPRYGGWRFPPRDYERWGDLIGVFTTHCLERYGLREVSRWVWELWNEPDIFYWQGSVEDYCRLYDYTVSALLSALPQAKVGGPGTTSPGNPKAGAFLHTFLDHCVNGINAVTGQIGTRLDYISFHTKGGGFGNEPNAPKKTPTIDTLTRHIVAGLAIIAEFPSLRHHEIILSECDPDGWAAGSIRENPNLFYRNTEYYASYVANAVCKLLDIQHKQGPRVDAMLTWAFQFEDRELFAGLRTLSTNGIDKPVLNVFRLLANLGSTQLSFVSNGARNPADAESGDTADTPPDISGIATMDAQSIIRIFLCSHHDDWDVHASTAVTVELSGLMSGQSYRIQQNLIDHEHSNAHTIWTQMGKPQPPSAEQYRELQAAARVKVIDSNDVTTGTEGVVLTLQLPAHSICLLILIPK